MRSRKEIPHVKAALTEIGGSYDRVALVFQGGGALGAYQAGVYEALAEADLHPNWLSGVSIGAINSAIIAGNPPEKRVKRLREFWELISGRKIWLYTPDGDMFRAWRNQWSSMITMGQGQPGFFEPRPVNPWLLPRGAEGATSFYDTSPLRETLLRVIDFDLLNNDGVFFSVGAVNVRTGNFLFFDNRKETIGPEHIMASGALPPAFPPILIDGDYYWDGGIVSNTPLLYLLSQEKRLSTLAFQVDLFNANGTLPRDMRDVMGRHKDITYSSRTRFTTDSYRRIHDFRVRVAKSLAKIPPELRDPEDEALIAEVTNMPPVNIAHLIYQQKSYEGSAKDYEFSHTSMLEHWKSGYDDTKRTLMRPDWLQKPADGCSVVVHDLHRDFDR
ncbi:patatin-like phospholipase family protein [Oleomonas cavernae]|uniref:Patatin-like phospholipase family protein n=1 Tax=Oleomonas cavernae TaxID=2320859 RepID=A0A418WIR5_9PROT|nr:patatin-like phospholipase family protein [Oleomonas cavernae]RJF89870.1 patatin-like phospholipase family protein [Oleomonas cavernae]